MRLKIRSGVFGVDDVLRLALSLRNLGSVKECFDALLFCLSINPGHAPVIFQLGLTHLLLKNWKDGWNSYEVRLIDPRQSFARAWRFGKWEGEEIAGKRVFVSSEQGLGDEVMFSSYIPDLERLVGDGKIFLECSPALMPVYRRSFPGVAVHGRNEDRNPLAFLRAEDVDLEIPVGSLPIVTGRLDPSMSSGPWIRDYPRKDKVLRIGVAWMGGSQTTRRGDRSLSLEELLPVFRSVPHAEFLSLQHDEDPKLVSSFSRKTKVDLRVSPFRLTGDVERTAKLICSCDMVVSVCSTIVHLCGAMGKPCLVLAPFVPEWRYGLTGAMPWYHSVKMYRQHLYNDWDEAILTLSSDLCLLASSKDALFLQEVS